MSRVADEEGPAKCVAAANISILFDSARTSLDGSGYEADKETGSQNTNIAEEISLQTHDALNNNNNNKSNNHNSSSNINNNNNNNITNISSTAPWTTDSSKHHIAYALPPVNYNYVEDLKIKNKYTPRYHARMVLEPKFVDYGSIHPTADVPQLQQHNSSHALLSPRSVLSLPPLDEEDSPDTSKGTKMTQGDLYQRQPLLPNPGKSDKWGHGTHTSSGTEYFVDEDEDDIMHKTGDSNGVIKINMPPPIREEPRFPQERWKTVLASIIMCFNFILTLTSLSLVHERVPNRTVYGPLPDVFLDNVPELDWALDVSEYIIMVCITSCMIAIVFHKHRFIVFRRIFLIMSLLYMYRAITMYVTVLPISSKNYVCSPKSNNTSPILIIKRIIKLMSGFGLSVNGKHVYCGDFIYSGHTVTLVLSYQFISEYTPKKLYPLHWLYWVLAVVGVVMLQISHGHYTVDVVIAYYVTTRIFWTYHTLANNTSLKQYASNNLLSRSWWFCLFLYFEGNVGGPIPREFDWPLPWPRRFHSKSRDS